MTISVWCHSALKITDIFQNSKMVLRPVLVILSPRQDKNIAAPVKLNIVPVSKLMLKSRIFQMLKDEKTYCPDIEIRFHFGSELMLKIYIFPEVENKYFPDI